jgi:molybdopterin-guanine dinucleotide biosynthesis protein A
MSTAAKHQKHAKLNKPALGQFARTEWAIIGTPCGNIQTLAFDLIEKLKGEFALGYVDADLASADGKKSVAEASGIAAGAIGEYTDKINFHRFDTHEKLDPFQYRPQFYGTDGVIVNGNHFLAKNQIVVIDPKKDASLRKKLDRLTDVRLFLLTTNSQEIPTYLKEHISDWAQIPVLQLEDTAAIAAILQEDLVVARPILKGLVLAGGKSQRMGTDKGLLSYHGKPQREYMAEQLAPICSAVSLSCRPGQQAEINSSFPLLPDTFMGLGPYGAILSAFREDPNAAWLVVACDLPFLGKDTLEYLLAHRNPSKLATAFLNPATDFPDPLVTMWEPRAYPALFSFLAQGFSCPRKVLINSDIELLTIPSAEALRNVNTTAEYEAVKQLLD